MSIEMNTESIILEIAEVESVSSVVSGVTAVSVNLTETLARGLEASYLKFARDIVERLANEHGFNADEALELLGIAESVAINISSTSNNKPKPARKIQQKDLKEVKEKVVKEVKEKVVKEVKEKVAKKVVAPALKPAFPLPFCGTIHDSCSGLCYADGLFLQCANKKNAGDFCKRCAADAAKNEHGKPSHGIIQDRIQHLQDFQAPNGKKQVPYYKIMKKLNLTQEQVEAEALRLSLVIDVAHFAGEVAEPPKAKKERAVTASKKISAASVIEAQVDDIFAGLTAQIVAESALKVAAEVSGDSNDAHTDAVAVAVAGETKVAAKPVKKANKKGGTAAADVVAGETQEVVVAVAVKAPKEVAVKAPKEVAVKAPKQVKEKVVKEAAVKAPKEAAVKAPKEVKEKVAVAEKVQPQTGLSLIVPNDDELEEEEEEEEALEVKKMVVGGIEYLISTDNDAYHPITKEHVGLYIPDENRVEPVEESDCEDDNE
jgi:hypothetical protein